MDANLAASLTKTALRRSKADLAKVHPAAKEITRTTAPKTDPVPLHRGAKKYYG